MKESVAAVTPGDVHRAAQQVHAHTHAHARTHSQRERERERETEREREREREREATHRASFDNHHHVCIVCDDAHRRLQH